MSLAPFVSPATRLFANEVNATNRPSAEIDGGKLVSLPCVPCEATLTRLVLPALRSRTNPSPAPFLSPATSLLAHDRNATNRPSAEIDAAKLSPLACAPWESTLTRWVLPVLRSRTKTSPTPFVSPFTSWAADDPKATKRPSAEIATPMLSRLPCAPLELTLTRVVLPVLRSRTKTSVTPFVSPATRLAAYE